MKSKRKSLVSQYLEGISRRALEDYQDVVRNFVRRRHGIYVLYRRDRLYYVGLASNLRNRLKAHLSDRHGKSWDRFSIYLTIQDGHIKELESLALRILRPVGNRTGGKFARAENLRPRLAQDIRDLERKRLIDILGPVSTRRKPRSNRQPREQDSKPILGEFPNRPTWLRRKYKGKVIKARVRPDGSIRVADRTFNSPSLAARSATGGHRAVNGWTFWYYERAPGDWVRLSELRE